MSIVLACLTGLLAGAHAATWGMYKDAMHEGFTFPKYFRSIVVGGAVGVAWQLAEGFDLTRPANFVILFGLVYVGERALVELWKTFLREEDQSKYFIPMQFSLFGVPVRSRPVRWLVFVVCLAAIAGGVALVRRLQGAATGLPPWGVVLFVGALAGMFTAIGGAWKDAPKEGFSVPKFFRSPAMTVANALLLGMLTDNYLHIALGALGSERAMVETYKTFFFPNRPRGKFAGKPILFPEMVTRRLRFVPLYVAIWAAVIGASLLAFMLPRTGAI
jgi:hypothetical protein